MSQRCKVPAVRRYFYWIFNIFEKLLVLVPGPGRVVAAVTDRRAVSRSIRVCWRVPRVEFPSPTFIRRNVDNILRSQRFCIVGRAGLAVFESVEKTGPPASPAPPTILVASSSPKESIMREIPF